jgi:hypothetical protein
LVCTALTVGRLSPVKVSNSANRKIDRKLGAIFGLIDYIYMIFPVSLIIKLAS